MLPAVLYIPLLVASYFIFDLFQTETAEIPDKTLQTTEFLNPDLPDARLKGGDGIGSKYENMAKSWGKIQDYSAVDNIERDEPDDNKEEYESQYTVDDIALLDEQQQEKAAAAQIADAKTREQEALAELEKALAEARLRGRNEVLPATDTDSTASAQPPTATIEVKGKIEEESRSVKAPSENEPPSEVVRKVKTASDYFNTLAVNAREPKLIKAIIDEDIKAVDGSRVRLRLLDDVEINECVVKRGSYLYATMSGFSSGACEGEHHQHSHRGRTGEGQPVPLRHGRHGGALCTEQPVPGNEQGCGKRCGVGESEHEYRQLRQQSLAMGNASRYECLPENEQCHRQSYQKK